jgi:hypothetical protein
MLKIKNFQWVLLGALGLATIPSCSNLDHQRGISSKKSASSVENSSDIEKPKTISPVDENASKTKDSVKKENPQLLAYAIGESPEIKKLRDIGKRVEKEYYSFATPPTEQEWTARKEEIASKEFSMTLGEFDKLIAKNYALGEHIVGCSVTAIESAKGQQSALSEFQRIYILPEKVGLDPTIRHFIADNLMDSGLRLDAKWDAIKPFIRTYPHQPILPENVKNTLTVYIEKYLTTLSVVLNEFKPECKTQLEIQKNRLNSEAKGKDFSYTFSDERYDSQDIDYTLPTVKGLIQRTQ